VNAGQHIFILGVRVYRWVISPAKIFIVGPLGHCRFMPSCSAYAIEAVARHGVLAGSWLALKRLGRCHPWGGSGEDPVPQVLTPTLRPSQAQIPASGENRKAVPPEGGTPTILQAGAQTCCRHSA
jgi:hypothetical protein